VRLGVRVVLSLFSAFIPVSLILAIIRGAAVSGITSAGKRDVIPHLPSASGLTNLRGLPITIGSRARNAFCITGATACTDPFPITGSAPNARPSLHMQQFGAAGEHSRESIARLRTKSAESIYGAINSAGWVIEKGMRIFLGNYYIFLTSHCVEIIITKDMLFFFHQTKSLQKIHGARGFLALCCRLCVFTSVPLIRMPAQSCLPIPLVIGFGLLTAEICTNSDPIIAGVREVASIEVTGDILISSRAASTKSAQ